MEFIGKLEAGCSQPILQETEEDWRSAQEVRRLEADSDDEGDLPEFSREEKTFLQGFDDTKEPGDGNLLLNLPEVSPKHHPSPIIFYAMSVGELFSLSRILCTSLRRCMLWSLLHFRITSISFMLILRAQLS
jgi:hypothetical protein